MTNILLTLGLVIVAGGAIWGLTRYARARGRAETERDAARGATNAARRGHAIDEDVARMSDARLDDELRSERDDD